VGGAHLSQHDRNSCYRTNHNNTAHVSSIYRRSASIYGRRRRGEVPSGRGTSTITAAVGLRGATAAATVVVGLGGANATSTATSLRKAPADAATMIMSRRRAIAAVTTLTPSACVGSLRWRLRLGGGRRHGNRDSRVLGATVVTLGDGGGEARWDISGLGMVMAWSMRAVLGNGVCVRAKAVAADAAIGGRVAGRVGSGCGSGVGRHSGVAWGEGVMVVTVRLVMHGRGDGREGGDGEDRCEGVHFCVQNERGVYVKIDWNKQTIEA
jgi:hypothetical protein